ncbi:MAG: TIGR04500 family putative peptide maturation system protein [Chloroflexota bacterium]|nr:TIGR04500 family putative peptide maturation system protein [Chloroflexota bacterium]
MTSSGIETSVPLDPVSPALADALTYLRDLHRDGVGSDVARARLRRFQEQHPAVRIDLLWEEETYDESVHYDLLLRQPGGGTTTIGYCPERALPWPMRGVHRWSEGDLVRVNGTVLRVAQAMAFLDFIWDQAPVTDRIVSACLIQEELERVPVALSHDQVQRAMDAFRRGRRLYTAEETLHWMNRRGLTHDQLERLVADEAAIAALRDRVVGENVDAYFEANRAAFDSARIARCLFPDAARAEEAVALVRAEARDFYEMAQEQFLAGQAPSSMVFADVTRGTLATESEDAIFAAAPGDTVGPFQSEEGHAIVRLLAVEPGSLNEATRRKIKKLLFDEWLEERRRSALVEWYWGNASRTAPAACPMGQRS